MMMMVVRRKKRLFRVFVDNDNNYDDDAINRFISINGTFICSANDDDDDDAINRL